MCKFSPTLSKSKRKLHFPIILLLLLDHCWLMLPVFCAKCHKPQLFHCADAVDVTFICRFFFVCFFWNIIWQESQRAGLQVCPSAAIQLLLVQSVELSAECMLKSLIRSDWSRLWKSPRSSWSDRVGEGQTSVRRHSLNVFECLDIPPVHPLNSPPPPPPPPGSFKLVSNVLSQSFPYIFMTFTPC